MRELPRLLGGFGSEIDQRQQPVYFAGQFRLCEPVLQRDDQILPDRQLGKDTRNLHLDADAAADACRGVQLS